MIKHALFVRLEAKPGKEKELAQFLQTGLGMAQQETTTPVWFALQIGPSTFGIFDAFADEVAGRERPEAAGAGTVDRTHRRARREAPRLKPARKPRAVNDHYGLAKGKSHESTEV